MRLPRVVTPCACVKIFFAISIVTAVIQVIIFCTKVDRPKPTVTEYEAFLDFDDPFVENRISKRRLRPSPDVFHLNGKNLIEGHATSTNGTLLTPIELKRTLDYMNHNHMIFNLDSFGPMDKTKLVVVVQVHNRAKYLQELIQSLQKARHIEEVLLVFSHDYSSKEINEMIRSVHFAKAMQIFYPYSAQFTADFCLDSYGENMCDMHSNPNQGALARMRQHWWWKMNYVFDGIVKRYNMSNAQVMVLEEDHVVAPDFLHVFKLLDSSRKTVCPTCDMLNVGRHTRLKVLSATLKRHGRKSAMRWWQDNMGAVFSQDLWERIRQCAQVFCNHDDYNWDFALYWVGNWCLTSPITTLYAIGTRVFHVGDCGMHARHCNGQETLEKTKRIYADYNASFFPESLQFSKMHPSGYNAKKTVKYGGFDSPAAHKLCLKNTHPYNGS